MFLRLDGIITVPFDVIIAASKQLNDGHRDNDGRWKVLNERTKKVQLNIKQLLNSSQATETIKYEGCLLGNRIIGNMFVEGSNTNKRQLIGKFQLVRHLHTAGLTYSDISV